MCVRSACVLLYSESTLTIKSGTNSSTHDTGSGNSSGSALNKAVWLEDGRKMLVGDSRWVQARGIDVIYA